MFNITEPFLTSTLNILVHIFLHTSLVMLSGQMYLSKDKHLLYSNSILSNQIWKSVFHHLGSFSLLGEKLTLPLLPGDRILLCSSASASQELELQVCATMSGFLLPLSFILFLWFSLFWLLVYLHVIFFKNYLHFFCCFYEVGSSSSLCLCFLSAFFLF